MEWNIEQIIGDMVLEFEEIEHLNESENSDEEIYVYTKAGSWLTIICC